MAFRGRSHRVAGGVALSALLAAALPAGAATLRLEDGKGRVERLAEGGKAWGVLPGESFAGTLRTGADGHATVRAPNGKLELAPSSEVAFDGEGRAGLNRGGLKLEAAGGPLTVRVGDLSIEAKTGGLDLTAAADGAIELQSRGEVRIQQGQRQVEVASGQKFSLPKGGSLPEAPKVEAAIAPKPEPVVEAKPEPKPEPVVEAKPEPKPEPVVAPKPEPKPEPVVAPKPEPKPEPVVAPKPEPVVAPKPEPKPEPVVAPKPEPKPEPVVAPQPEPKPEPVVAPKPEPKPEPVVAPKPEPKPEPVVAPKPEPKPEPVVAPKPEPKPEPVAAPKPEAKPEPKAEAGSKDDPAAKPSGETKKKKKDESKAKVQQEAGGWE